jgi:carbamoyltransferase
LGISCFYHDSAVALVNDKEILFAAQEERFSRKKGDSNFPDLALSAMFDECKVSLEDITHVSYYEDPNLKLDRIAKTFLWGFPKNSRQIANFVRHFRRERYFPIQYIESKLGKKVRIHKHHESHAASTFLTSPFNSSAVLVIDGVGEWASTSIFLAKRDHPRLELIKEETFPNSLGLFYATLTSYAGFKVNSGEYKFMGLAPYGSPKYVELLRRNLIHSDDDGNVKLNMKFFGFTRNLTMWSERMISLFGFNPRDPEARIRQFDCDLARSTQQVLEEIYVKKARHALEITKQENLCLAGGVALNCVANGKLRQVLPIENIFVVPAAGDAGGALGAALLTVVQENPNSRFNLFNLKGAFLGTSYSDGEIETALNEAGLRFKKLSSQELEISVAKMLFQEKSVGARSIIASAVSPNMQSRLNLQIKKRESFRPFAPMILAEQAHDWFNWPKGANSNFMLFTADVADKKRVSNNKASANSYNGDIDLTKIVNMPRSKIPAVTHVDMSARLQTISSENPIHGLLCEYFKISGVPVLVNTSFNVRNEPIVESPTDAIRCFMTTDIDILVLGTYLVLKIDQANATLKLWENSKYVGELD